MKQIIGMIILIIILFSCKERDQNTFEYDYEVRSYYSNSNNPDNFKESAFYKNNTLVRKIGRDGDCTIYYYDATGQLIEIRWGRDCNYGRRNILIYDSLKNHIGYYSTTDSIVNLDTIKFDQIFFYDNQNRLIKERTNKRRDMDGVEFETWNYYEYKDDKISRELTLINSDTLWNGTYLYDSLGHLIQIYRQRKKLYEIEDFRYNAKELLIKKEIRSTANPITPEVLFSSGNNKRIYKYDSTGFLISEILYNHKGKEEIKIIYLKVYKPLK